MTPVNNNTLAELEKQLAAYQSMHACLNDIGHETIVEKKGQFICDYFKNLTGAVLVCIAFYEPKTERFKCSAVRSNNGNGLVGGYLVYDEDRLDFNHDFGFRADKKRELVIESGKKTARFSNKFTMICPLKVAGTVGSIIVAEFEDFWEPSEGFESEILTAFITQVNFIIESIVETQKLNEKAAHLQLLYEIGTKLSSIRDEDQLLEAILSLVEENVHVDRCSLMIMDNDRKFMRIKKAIGMNAVDTKKVKVRVGEGIAGHVADSGKPLLIKDISAETHLQSQVKTRQQYSTNSLLSIPLIAQQKVIGVINVNNRKDGQPFINADKELLIKIGSEIAVILQRSYMALQLKKARDLDQDINRSMI